MMGEGGVQRVEVVMYTSTITKATTCGRNVDQLLYSLNRAPIMSSYRRCVPNERGTRLFTLLFQVDENSR